MKPLKVCLIGAGRVGTFFSNIYNEYIEKAKITAIVDVDLSSAKLLTRNNNLSKNNVFTNFELAVSKQKFD